MDLDAFVAAHREEWQRLDELVRQRGLDGAEADEILDLYQRVATHLSVVRSAAPDPSLVTYLSSLLARARTRSAGTRTTSWSDTLRFFTETFPAALYRTRRWWLLTLVANVVVAFALGWWFVAHPQVETGLLSRAEVDRLVNSDFQGYYSEFAASHFAARVWTNNAWVAALCIAFGVLGLPVIYLLFQNILNVALTGALMVGHGRGGHRPRARGGAARLGRDRGVRDAVVPAHLGPAGDRRRGRDRFPHLRVHRRPVGAAARRDR